MSPAGEAVAVGLVAAAQLSLGQRHAKSAVRQDGDCQRRFQHDFGFVFRTDPNGGLIIARLAVDGDYGMFKLVVEDPAGFAPGMGVQIFVLGIQ